MDLSVLPRKSFRSNWPHPTPRGPNYLVPGMGGNLEAFGQALVDRMHVADTPDIQVLTAREVPYRPGSVVVLRVVKTDCNMIRNSVDIGLNRMGDSLFIRIRSQTRTWHKLLKSLLFATLFVIVGSIACTLLITKTGAIRSWVWEYLSSKGLSKVQTVEEVRIRQGWVRDESTDQWVKEDQEKTLTAMAVDNPLLAMRGVLGMCMGALSAIAVGLRFLTPRWAFSSACRILGWPTVEQVEAVAEGHTAWVDDQISSVLYQVFRIDARTVRVVGKA